MEPDDRWSETWALAGRPAPGGILSELLTRYREGHRAYHTWEHIAACLGLASRLRAAIERPAEVELALWYHDAIYRAWGTDNEARSAALAEAQLAPYLGGSARRRIAALILATSHRAEHLDGDAAIAADIDLEILAAPPDRFDAYHAAIRREYRWLPRPLYRRRRAAVLARLLDRERIFHSVALARLETAARANLTRALEEIV